MIGGSLTQLMTVEPARSGRLENSDGVVGQDVEERRRRRECESLAWLRSLGHGGQAPRIAAASFFIRASWCERRMNSFRNVAPRGATTNERETLSPRVTSRSEKS
jgi:hypothetical protein